MFKQGVYHINGLMDTSKEPILSLHCVHNCWFWWNSHSLYTPVSMNEQKSFRSETWIFFIVLVFFPHSHPFLVSGEPPKLLLMPSEVTVSSTMFYPIDGTQANLIILCNVTGRPTPTVTWFREGNLIDDSYVSGLTLFLNVTEDVKDFQPGVRYHCLATNRIGPSNSIEATVRSRNILVRHKCELWAIWDVGRRTSLIQLQAYIGQYHNIN